MKGTVGDAEANVIDEESCGSRIGAVVGIEPKLELALLTEESNFVAGEDVKVAVPGEACGEVVVGIASAQEFEKGGAVGRTEPGAQMIAAGISRIVAEITIIVFDTNVEGKGGMFCVSGKGEDEAGTTLLIGTSGQEEGMGFTGSDGVGDSGRTTENPITADFEVSARGDVFAKLGPDLARGPGRFKGREGAGVGMCGLEGGISIDAAVAEGCVFARCTEICGCILDDGAYFEGSEGGVTGKHEGGKAGDMRRRHAGTAHGAVAAPHTQRPDHHARSSDVDVITAVGEAGDGVGGSGGGYGDGGVLSSGPVIDLTAIVACCGYDDDAVLNCVFDGYLFATAVGCTTQAEVNHFGALIDGVENGFDFIGKGAEAGRSEDAEGHETSLGRYAGDAFSIIDTGSDDAGNVAPVTKPVVDVVIVGGKVPTINIIDKAIMVVIDAVVCDFGRVGPKGIFEVFVIEIDTAVDYSDDDGRVASGDIPGLGHVYAIEVASVMSGVIGGVVLVVGVVGVEVGCEQVVGFGEGDGRILVEAGERLGHISAYAVMGESQLGDRVKEGSGYERGGEIRAGGGMVLCAVVEDEDFLGSVRLAKGHAPVGGLGGGRGRRGRSRGGRNDDGNYE